MQPGRFRTDSDIDVAVEATDLETESAFWRALQRALDREVDVRPWDEPIISAVHASGEMVYERKDHRNYSAPGNLTGTFRGAVHLQTISETG
jgi:hypothetical protein